MEIQFITFTIVLNFSKDILANATKSKGVELLVSGWARSRCSIAVIKWNLFLPLNLEPCFPHHWCHDFTLGEKEGPRRIKFAISEKEILFLLLESPEIPLNGVMTGHPWSYGHYRG